LHLKDEGIANCVKIWEKGRSKIFQPTVMETITKHAQLLVYSLLCLMPTVYQKASLNAVLGQLLEAQGYPVPGQNKTKSGSSLSRFFNQYRWPTLGVLRAQRQALIAQLKAHPVSRLVPLQVIFDLTTLEKCGKFKHLSNPVTADRPIDPWVRVLNGKRGLHLVVMYLGLGDWRIPWSFRVWRGKGHPTVVELACKMLATVPKAFSQGRTVLVLGDTEFGTVDFLSAVRKRHWIPIVGMRSNRKLTDGRSLNQLYRQAKRGVQVRLVDLPFPVTVSWFWLKRAEGKRELRFVVSTHPYSGAYLVRLGRKRWAIEGFFKTIKHRFGWDKFGQSTRLGVYRWLLLGLIAYLLAHWIYLAGDFPTLDWQTVADLALKLLFPSLLWSIFLKQIDDYHPIAAQMGYQVILKPLPG
jgi:Transposase DDE domain